MITFFHEWNKMLTCIYKDVETRGCDLASDIVPLNLWKIYRSNNF